MMGKYTKRIQEALQVRGQGSAKTLARWCLNSGVFEDEDIAKAEVDWATRIVREALREHDSSGLPFAGQTSIKDEDGGRVWAQRELWKAEDYEVNIHEHIRNRDANHLIAQKLQRECHERHGKWWDLGAKDDAA